MTTLETLYQRAKAAARGATMRAILADSPKLASLADGICDLAERGHARRDEGLLRGAINAARSLGRRVRRQAGAA